jgi:coenzyme F420-0:L-glutamate ligase / coenzyme F420-1:gamma-L-glutamate ligase
MPTACAPRLEVFAVPGIPVLRAGDDLSALLLTALGAAEIELRDGDVLVVASKAVSRCEGRFVDLATVEPSERAHELSRITILDARFVELVVRESTAVSRTAREALIVRDRHGFVHANAGIDLSNAKPADAPAGTGPWALLLPVDPDASAESIRRALSTTTKAAIGVIVSDSFGRPFRLGTVGTAIGVAGVPALWNKRGEVDLFDRTLEHTETALADQIAATADLVAGQGGEGRAAVVVRGVSFDVGAHGVHELLRPPNKDLYA